jgi:putative transposase
MNGHRKACRRYHEPGQAHSLTFSCFGRRPFLSIDRGRLWLVEAIDRARQQHAFDLWAYVIRRPKAKETQLFDAGKSCVPFAFPHDAEMSNTHESRGRAGC